MIKKVFLALLLSFFSLPLTAYSPLASDAKPQSFQSKTAPQHPAAIQSSAISPEYHYQESLEELPREPDYGNLSLSLKETVVTSLNKNFDIQIEKFTPKISETGINAEKGIFDPSFTAAIVNSRTLQENASSDQTVEDRLKGTAGISKRFTPGTKLALSFETTDNDDPGTDGQYNSALKLVLTQNLLKNFGTDINTAKVFIAEKEHEQSRKALLKRVIDVVADVQNAYWDYYQNNRVLEIRRKSYALTRNLFLKKKEEARLGALAPIELVEIESRVATRITEYLEARKLVQQSDIKLRTLLDLPFNFESKPVWILPADKPGGFEKTFDFGRSLQTALNNQPDFQKILLRLTAKEREAQYTRNQILPDLEATASYGVDRYANAWDDSMSVYGAGNNYELGLRLTVPLGNREAKSNYTKTRLELEQIKKEKSRKELEIKRDISKAKIELELSILLYRSSVNDLKLKKKNLHAAEQKLKYGTAGLRQLLDVQTELIEANLKLVEAEVGYEKALVEMYKAQGVFDPKLQIDIATLYTQ